MEEAKKAPTQYGNEVYNRAFSTDLREFRKGALTGVRFDPRSVFESFGKQLKNQQDPKFLEKNEAARDTDLFLTLRSRNDVTQNEHPLYRNLLVIINSIGNSRLPKEEKADLAQKTLALFSPYFDKKTAQEAVEGTRQALNQIIANNSDEKYKTIVDVATKQLAGIDEKLQLAQQEILKKKELETKKQAEAEKQQASSNVAEDGGYFEVGGNDDDYLEISANEDPAPTKTTGPTATKKDQAPAAAKSSTTTPDPAPANDETSVDAPDQAADTTAETKEEAEARQIKLAQQQILDRSIKIGKDRRGEFGRIQALAKEANPDLAAIRAALESDNAKYLSQNDTAFGHFSRLMLAGLVSEKITDPDKIRFAQDSVGAFEFLAKDPQETDKKQDAENIESAFETLAKKQIVKGNKELDSAVKSNIQSYQEVFKNSTKQILEEGKAAEELLASQGGPSADSKNSDTQPAAKDAKIKEPISEEAREKAKMAAEAAKGVVAIAALGTTAALFPPLAIIGVIVLAIWWAKKSSEKESGKEENFSSEEVDPALTAEEYYNQQVATIPGRQNKGASLSLGDENEQETNVDPESPEVPKGDEGVEANESQTPDDSAIKEATKAALDNSKKEIAQTRTQLEEAQTKLDQAKLAGATATVETTTDATKKLPETKEPEVAKKPALANEGNTPPKQPEQGKGEVQQEGGAKKPVMIGGKEFRSSAHRVATEQTNQVVITR